jgi:hypothetical protein
MRRVFKEKMAELPKEESPGRSAFLLEGEGKVKHASSNC